MLPTDEQWAAIPGYDGKYEASTLGRVRCLSYARNQPDPPRILNSRSRETSDHQKVRMPNGWKLVHRLILMTFDRPPNGGEVTRHLDGNPTNNKLDNLCWGTMAENAEDRDRHGTTSRGESHPRAKLTRDDVAKIREMYQGGMTPKMIAEKYSVMACTISNVVAKNGTWRHTKGGADGDA